jgi:hypothetical protein
MSKLRVIILSQKESSIKMYGSSDYSSYQHHYAEDLEHEVFHNKELFDKYKEVVSDLPEAVFKYRLSEGFIEHHEKEISFDRISVFQKLSEKFIVKHHKKLRMDYISFYQDLSEEVVEKHEEIFDWYNLSSQKGFSWKFRIKHKDKLNWDYVSRYVIMTEEEIRTYSEYLNFYEIFPNQKLSNEFINEFSHKVDWNVLLDEFFYPETTLQIEFIEQNKWRIE